MNRSWYLRCLAGMVAALGPGPWVYAADPPRYEPEQTHLPASVVNVPMELVDRLPLVEAKINGKGPYLCILDTGASLTALNRPVARELNLTAHKSASIGTSSGAKGQTANVVELGALELEAARFAGVEAVVVDLGFVVGGHRTIDGLLGFGLFTDCLLTIDYPARTVRLERGELASDKGRDVLRYVKAQGFPRVRLRLADRTVQVTVDSGDNDCLTLPRSLRKKLTFHAPPISTGRIRLAGAEHEAKLARVVGELRIGRHFVTDPLVRLFGRSGILGNQVLQHFAVTFDQKNARVRFVREAPEPITIPPVRSRGLYTAEHNGVRRVVEVIPDTAAAQLGIKVRDRIIRVNNRPYAELTSDEWLALWNSDQPLRLTLARRKERHEVTLPMVELVP